MAGDSRARHPASTGLTRRGAASPMEVNFGPGFHVASGGRVDPSAYDGYVGLWSRLFVPDLLAAARLATSHRLLDVATGPGEAISGALPQLGPSGLVVGV